MNVQSRPESGEEELGNLPSWDLADLYPAIDAPEVRQDLETAEAAAKAFEARCKGELAALAGGPTGGAALAAAIVEYERIDDASE